MSRTCTICSHPERNAIDRALIESRPLREVARHYETSKDALFRHKAEHLPGTLVKAKEAEDIASAGGLLKQIVDLQQRTLTVLEKAEDKEDLKTVLQAVRESRGNLELLAKMLGELHEGQGSSLRSSSQWVSIRSVILQVLAPYPEAQLRLVEALEDAGG